MNDRAPLDPDVEDIQRLLLQLHAGILLCEEVLERDDPGYWARKTHRGETPALRNAWGQMSMAWINLGGWLLKAGVESWTITPLATHDTRGGTTQLEFGPGGNIDVSPDVVPNLDLRVVPKETVRVVEVPPEPKYTLAQARAILEVCSSHSWEVETTPQGTPTAVRCANCGERRPLAGGASPAEFGE